MQRPCGRRSLALRGLEGGVVNEFQWEKAKVTKTTWGGPGHSQMAKCQESYEREVLSQKL